MTPWLRVLRAAGLVLALGAGAVVSPYGSVPSHGAAAALTDEEEGEAGLITAPSPLSAPSARAASSVPSALAAPSALGEPSWAGSRAGEGRVRPGRPEDAGERPGVTDATAVPETPREPAPEPSAPAEQPVREAATADRRGGPVLRILPLGSGLVLIGLGLGLAFVGLRLRRV
ncbi:hypothetical protein QNO09_02550 [Streptomyces sp. 378]|uniref:hypothetical protein n=1 Tax=Streptomyces sp. 378 TaxID=3049412 RepID=UPI0024C22698|nr:hypothetical protein [Streptomyces sp. 378]MDK1342211.1 hypothetical protein [Streptomyces sp. 378]